MKRNRFELFSLVFSGLVISFLMFVCTGKDGERGPLGPGATMTTHAGAMPAGVLNTGSYVYEWDVDAPELGSSSVVQVYVSSNSLNWIDWGASDINLSSQSIHIYVSWFGSDYYSSGAYKVFVTNPS